MDNARIGLLIGVVVVVLISRFNRMIGGILGVLLTAAIAWWGMGLYSSGNAVGIIGTPISKTAFMIFVGVFFLFNLFSIWMGFKSRKKRSVDSAGGKPEKPR